MTATVAFFYQGVFPFLKRKHKVAHCLRRIAKAEGHHIQWLHVIFCSKKHLYRLNVKHMNHRTHTDILTFDHTSGDGVSGELFLSIPCVQENASRYGVTWANELWRVIIHGLLHLLAYKDDTPRSQRRMRKKEDLYIRRYLSTIVPCSTGNI